MSDRILTTGEAARQLGISIPTMQSWIEAQALPSWRTKGGHRRVRQSDVTALIGKTDGRPSTLHRVFVLAPIDRHGFYERLEKNAPACRLERHDDLVDLLIACGRQAPSAIIFETTSDFDIVGTLVKAALSAWLSQTRFFWVETISAARDAHAPYALRGSGIELVNKRRVAQQLEDRLNALSRIDVTEDEIAGSVSACHSADDATRDGAIERSGLSSGASQPQLSELVWTAATILACPIALVTILTTTQQWFIAAHGLNTRTTPRADAFCNWTIRHDALLELEDVSSHPQFTGNPLVVGPDHIRFYAGVPLLDEEGFALGAFCALDRVPRRLDVVQRRLLIALAKAAQSVIQLQSRCRLGVDAAPA